MSPLRLVLASGSPRRRELLERLALDFTIEPADIDESTRPGEAAGDYVARLAHEKAAAVSRPGTVVLAADTSVVVDGEILGKPVDGTDASAMLDLLSGRSHTVVTGVSVRRHPADGPATGADAVEETTVHVDVIGPARAAWYVGTDEPHDKAGAYALQGAAALFADRVEGSVSNVIGLPLPLVDRLFRELGLDLLAYRRPTP
jgi:septum formation protein